MKQKTWSRVALALAACFFASGCANTRLYNPADDALAKRAGEAVVAADLKSALVLERSAMQELAKREQGAVKRDQLGLLDRKIAALLSATTAKSGWELLDEELSSRLKVLAGSFDRGRAIESAVLRRDDAATKLSPLRQNYLVLTKGRTALSCPVTSVQRPESGSELEIAIKPFESACAALQRASAELQSAIRGQGELALLAETVAEMEAARSDYSGRLTAAKGAYQEALEKSKAPATADKPGVLATLKARFDDIGKIPKPKALLGDKVLSKLTESSKLEKVLAERQALESLIQSFDAEAAASGTTTAQERLTALRNLSDALSAPTMTPLTALILQSEHLRLEAGGIERHVARANERVALLRKKQASMVDEVRFLNSAQKALTDFSGAGRCAKQGSLYDTFLSTTANCRFLLAQALSDYVNAATFGKTEQELIDYQLIAQGHEAALDESETALAQTDNLMRVPASQLAKAYGGGLKSDEISNLVNALGLGAIAARVK